MKELNSLETKVVSGGSFLGVIVYGSIGFWVGGFTGFCMGGLPAIPGSVIGMTLGAYLGTDGTPPQIHYHVNSKEELPKA